MELQFRQPKYTVVSQLIVILLFVTVLLFCYKAEFNINIRCDNIQVEHLSNSRIEMKFNVMSNREEALSCRKLRTYMTLEVENEKVTGYMYKYLVRTDGLFIIGISTKDSLQKSKYKKGIITIKKNLFDYIVENISSK